jgi:hypothetical protein
MIAEASQWVTLAGDIRQEGPILRYTPTVISSGPAQGQRIVAQARSSVWFQQGTISYQVEFEDKYSTCAFVLDDYQALQVGISGGQAGGPLYAAIRWVGGQPQTLAVSGNADINELGTFIPVRIQVGDRKSIYTCETSGYYRLFAPSAGYSPRW